MSGSLPEPSWDETNAETHRQKHGKCFQRILGIGHMVTLDEFKTRCQLAITGSWAEFEARKLENDLAAYYADDDLVQAVTTLDRSIFRTCFHEHFDRPSECQALIAKSVGDRRALFLRHLNYREQGRVFTGVKRIRGV